MHAELSVHLGLGSKSPFQNLFASVDLFCCFGASLGKSYVLSTIAIQTQQGLQYVQETKGSRKKKKTQHIWFDCNNQRKDFNAIKLDLVVMILRVSCFWFYSNGSKLILQEIRISEENIGVNVWSIKVQNHFRTQTLNSMTLQGPGNLPWHFHSYKTWGENFLHHFLSCCITVFCKPLWLGNCQDGASGRPQV